MACFDPDTIARQTLDLYRVALGRDGTHATSPARVAPRLPDAPDPDPHPLHIVFVTLVASMVGGVETYVRSSARALSRQGQRVTILYLGVPGSKPAGPASDGPVRLAYVAAPNAHYYYHRALQLLPPFLRRRLPDPAAVRAAEGSLALRLALGHLARRSGGIDVMELPEEMPWPALFRGMAPYSVKLHGSWFTVRHFAGYELRPRDLDSMRAEGALLRRASLVTAPNGMMADYIAAACAYPRSRILTLPYPLDIERFKPASGGSSDDVGPSASHSVLYVGRMDIVKGLETLMEAAGAILGTDPVATIEVVGGETEEVTAAGLLARVPPALRPRVVFHGRVAHADLPAYYQRAAVCVVPSRWDNSPITVYEAMGCGVPVVASRVGGIPELVADGETGLLVARDDPAALAGAVTVLLADAERRARMGRAARARAVACFDPDTIARQMLHLYRGAANRTRRPGDGVGDGSAGEEAALARS